MIEAERVNSMSGCDNKRDNNAFMAHTFAVACPITAFINVHEDMFANEHAPSHSNDDDIEYKLPHASLSQACVDIVVDFGELASDDDDDDESVSILNSETGADTDCINEGIGNVGSDEMKYCDT